MKFEKYVTVNLDLFDEGASGESAAGGESAEAAAQPEADTQTAQKSGRKNRKSKNPLADVKYGKQSDDGQQTLDREAKDADKGGNNEQADTIVTTDTADDRKTEFEKLISGEYKDLFTQRTQQIIDERFKQTKGLEEQVSTLTPLVEMLGSKYGVDPKDVEALSQAIEEDEGFYQKEAIAKGLTVEQLKQFKKMESENAEFRRTEEERKRQQAANEVYTQWQMQADETKQFYPNFDLQEESSDPQSGYRFLALLKNGIDVKTAYEVVHKDDIIGGAMQYTAQQVQKKTVESIRARGMRPIENGAGSTNAAVTVRSDPSKYTKKDRQEISRRVLRGEHIVL